MGDGFQYNPDEIEDILKKYSGDTTSQQNTGSSKPVEPLFTTRNVGTDKEEKKKVTPKVSSYDDDDDISSWFNDETSSKYSSGSKIKMSGSSSGSSKISLKGSNHSRGFNDMPEDNFDDLEKSYNSPIKVSGSGSGSRSSGSSVRVGSSGSEKPRVSRAEIIKQSAQSQKEHDERREKREQNNYQEKLRKERVKKNKRTNLILNILLVFFILVFVGSGAYLGLYFYRIRKAENSFEDIKKLITEDVPDDEGEEDEEGGTGTHGTGRAHMVDVDGVMVQSKFSQIYKTNKDFIGWLNIPGTKIDYPVMHTPADEEYYLRRDFSGEYSTAGTLFIAAKSDALTPTDNVIIYGHNMKAGTMFHTLLEYEDEEYYQGHKTILFDTISGNAEYEIIAAFRTVITADDSSFKYYEFIDAENEQAFNDYVAKAKELTPYDIPATAEYGDKLLTLSTCAYHANSGRYVVVAKLLVDEEEEEAAEEE